MKNIKELLKEVGIEIPEEKSEEFEKAFNENYKTIAEVAKLKDKLEASDGNVKNLNETIAQRDKDLEELKKKLEESGQDASQIEALQKELDDMKKKYSTQQEEFEKANKKRDYEAVIKEAAKDLKFSSSSAKKAFMAEAIKKEFTVEDGKALGFKEFADEYKENDPDAFVSKTDVGGVNKGDGTNDGGDDEGSKQVPKVW